VTPICAKGKTEIEAAETGDAPTTVDPEIVLIEDWGVSTLVGCGR
jgi:hypothetical protein